MKTLVVAMIAVAGTGWGLASHQGQNTDIDEVKPAPPQGIVTIRIPEGTVVVEGWDRDEVAIQGTLAHERDAFEFHDDHGHTEISVTPHRVADATGETRLTIRVPAGSSVDVDTEGTDVDVSDVTGMVRLASGTGNLSIAGAPAGIVAVSQHGDIDIRAPGVRGVVHSENGNVRLHGGRSGNIVATREAHRAMQMARIQSRRWAPALDNTDWTASSQTQLRDLIDVERWDGGMDIRVADAIDIGLDFDALEAMLESIGAELEIEIEDLAEALEDELAALAEALDEEYHDRWERADRRRGRRSGR
jgi:uncharacterized protein YdeI (BOF family)